MPTFDGELSPSDKAKVQKWLDADPQFKQLYTQLLTLQGKIQHFVTPVSEKSTEEITEGVFQSIDFHRRRQRKLAWGGGAIRSFYYSYCIGCDSWFFAFVS